MARFALTIFLSAFLLFQVQPLMGKIVLPWYGGTPAVWTTCMLFFQILLLGGYAYAHFLHSRFSPRVQGRAHLALLVASLFFSSITPGNSWKPTGEEQPTWSIMLLLAATVGPPYFLLSSTGPLLQGWFRQTFPVRSPFRLYSLSNVGSLLALLSYPFAIEPWLTLATQGSLWTWAYRAFVLVCGYCAWRIGETAPSEEQLSQAGGDAAAAARGPRPKLRDLLLWLGLSTGGSVMLLASTNQMCQEMTVTPFMWVLPLSLYLLSFIICFDHERWYLRGPFSLGLAVFSGLACWVLFRGNWADMRMQVVVFTANMFFAAMVCHGELVRARPDARYLTLFYLTISAGGALGGTLVAVGAPYFFRGYWEYHFGAILCCLLGLAAIWRDREWLQTGKAALWAGALLAFAATFGGLDADRRVQIESDEARLAWALDYAKNVSMLLGAFLAMAIAGALPLRRWRWLTVWAVAVACGATAGLLLLKTAGRPPTFPTLGRDLAWEDKLLFAWRWAAGWLLHLQAPLAGGIGLSLAALLAAFHRERWLRIRGRPVWAFVAPLAAMLPLVVGLIRQIDSEKLFASESTRNFYGVLRLERHASLGIALTHGRTTHGFQYTQDPELRFVAVSYFGPGSGIYRAMTLHPRRKKGLPLRIGVLGLGVGTVAAFADRREDSLRFYEINPQVIEFSERVFTYYRDSPAHKELILGDARLQMEREAEAREALETRLADDPDDGAARQELAELDARRPRLDVLAIDAFNSDSVPMHLLTYECVGTYLKLLNEDGILCFNITNAHLDLGGVVFGLANEYGLRAVRISHFPEYGEQDFYQTGSEYVLLTENEEFLDDPEIRAFEVESQFDDTEPIVWRDDYGALWQALRKPGPKVGFWNWLLSLGQ